MGEIEWKAIAILTEWRLVSTFRCIAVKRSRFDDESSSYEVHAEPCHSSYFLTDLATGRVSSYDDYRRERITGGIPEVVYPYQFHGEAIPARLAFPMSLSVWGRRNDTYRMVKAVEDGERLTVNLVNKKDPDDAGRLVIDVARRAVVELDTSSLWLTYEGVEPAQDRFWPAS
jgi:hypothetical protein